MRLFSAKQKKILYVLAHGKCNQCGQELGRNWEADHIIPFSKGGTTTLDNGQALCRDCNRKKSDNMTEINFRPWQEKFFKKVNQYIDKGKHKFFCVAGVGSGKTFASLAIANNFIKNKGFDSVVIVSNTENIKSNWAATALENFSLDIDTDYTFKYNWRGDFDGISITYQALNETNVEVLRRSMINRGTLLIIDEVHHAGDDKTWGAAIQEIGELCGFILLLSGTPTRSDNSKIPFVNYGKISENEYELESDYSYTYADSVRDKICAPVEFHKHQGRFETFFGSELNLHEGVKDTDAVPHLRNILDPIQSTFVFDMLDRANKKLDEINELTGKNYAGLVVCNTISNAERLYHDVCDKYGPDFAVLVHSQDKESNKKIIDFKNDITPWIISVKQVSEGVDIPRIRAIVYASAYTAQLFFTQVIGRGVRNPEHYSHHIDTCHVYIPEYAPLIDNANNIRDQIKHIIKDLDKDVSERGQKTFGLTGPLFDDYIINSEIINSGSIYAGQSFTPSDRELIESIAKQANFSTEAALYLISEWSKGSAKREQKAIEKVTMTKTDRKRNICQKIHSKVNVIYHAKNGEIEYHDIHRKLNSMVGVETQNAMTEKQLGEKLKFVDDWIRQLKKNVT